MNDLKKKVFIVTIVLVGFLAVFLLWPRTVQLPKLGTIDEPLLMTTKGETFSLSSEKPKLITFFYTQCPDVCPMTILDLKDLHQKLEEEGIEETAYDVILITLDPEVDTAERIEQYKDHFNISAENWFFIRGNVEQTKEVTKQFNMIFKKDNEGFIAHSTKMYLLDEKNNIRAYHDMNTGQTEVNLDHLKENILALVQ